MAQDADSARLVRDVLGPEVVGAYLLGSAAEGGLHPHSDIDVLVVSRRGLAPRERRELVDGLMSISGRPERDSAARPVELTLVVHDEVRPWRYPPRCEFQYGEWLRDEFERGELPRPAPNPDLAVLITMVLRGGAALFGPPPETVFDPVPGEDVERALTAGVPELLAGLESDTRNAVLTLARIWMTLATGDIGSKSAAADWALERLPADRRAVLVRARAAYLGEHEDSWDDLLPHVRPWAAHVVTAIEHLSDSRPSGGSR